MDYSVSGVYPVGPPVPAVGGNEGVGEVIAVADGVEKLAVNDWVIPAMAGLGRCPPSVIFQRCFSKWKEITDAI